nr:hypothetical protein [Tanacetum cinerariifolium]
MNLTTLLFSFWDYALESATRILNIVPTKKVDKKPYELWYGKVPNLSYLKVWGCKVLMKHDMPDKLQPRYVKCIFGFSNETMGYYFYFPSKNEIVVIRHTEFFKKNLISQKSSLRAVDLEEFQDEDASPSENTSNNFVEIESLEPQKDVAPIEGDLNEPTIYKDAFSDLESAKWLDDMNEEMQSMKYKKVRRLVDLPPNAKTVEKTFSHVAYIRAIRILIAIEACYDYEIWQMDVKTAFLNGYLNEYIYMVQPEGFIDPKHPRKCIFGFSNETMGYYFYFPSKNEIVVIRHTEFFKKNLISQKSSLRAVDLEEFQDEDASPSENTSNNFVEIESLEPQKDVAPIEGNNIIMLQDVKCNLGRNLEAELGVTCYCDDGFDTNINDIKSQTGYVFVLNEGGVDWKSSKKSITSMSVIKAKYIAASEATMEVVLIRKFISGLGIVGTNFKPIEMYCDNYDVILIANEPGV